MKNLILLNFSSVLQLGTRALALAARFCLSLFMVKYLDLEAIGLFGLIVGLTNFVPPAIGLGLSFFVMRDIIGKSNFEAGRRLRDRVALTTMLLFLCYIFVLGAMGAGFVQVPENLALILLIIFLETFALDIHFALMYLKMPLLANALIFVRTASWVGPFIVAAYLLPATSHPFFHDGAMVRRLSSELRDFVLAIAILGLGSHTQSSH